MEQKNVWETYSTKQLKELEALNEAYRGFLSECKTERECVDYIVNMAEEAGYKELQDIIKKGGRIKKGDKVYSVWMNKSVALFHIGEKKMEEGMNILGAHIDSPRLDIKQNPVPIQTVDEAQTLFGIRTITVDSVRGLRINGKPVKLKGGCVHHDNGLLGAVSLYECEERKIRKLKEIMAISSVSNFSS